MTEFTFAPGEKNIIGDRFSPSVIIFWLKTSIAASSTRIQYTTPNTLFGLIPLGADTKTIPLRNVASVDTSTKFNLGSLVWGVVFLLIGLGCLDSSVAVALVLILVAASNLANTMSAQLDFVNQAGGRNSVKVSILEKDKLMQLAQNIQRLVFADVEGQRHQESMDMAQKQYTAQTRSVLIQQQMLDQHDAAVLANLTVDMVKKYESEKYRIQPSGRMREMLEHYLAEHRRAVAAIMERHRGDERAVLSFSRVSNLPEGLPDWVRAEESVKRRAAAVREAAVLLEAEGVAVDYTYMPEETE